MDLIIEVRDAADGLICGAEAAVIFTGAPTGKTDETGRCVLGPLPSVPFMVSVTHPLYLEEEVNVVPPKGEGYFVWDNPVCTVILPATIIIRLSRLRAAPLFPISNRELEQRDKFIPKGIFTWIDDAGNPTSRYLSLFNNEELFVPVNHPLLPDNPTEGWGRLNHSEPIKINPSQMGNLVWLEWGIGDGMPCLLLAVWVPRWRGITPSKLDFVIFFSPNTDKFDEENKPIYPPDGFPWLGSYPFEAWKGGKLKENGPPALYQPYPMLGHRYLFHEKWLVYQLLAAKRQAVVVFPIQPFGDWGPFKYAAGQARLLAEVTHFLHRTGYTSGGRTSKEVDLAPNPQFRIRSHAMHQPPPTVQRVVLSGFSAGMAPITQMIETSIGKKIDDKNMKNDDKRFDSSLWKANVYPFLNAWKEVWDHDAPNDIRKSLDKSLPEWLNKDGCRMARCYQTDYTGSQGWIESSPLVKYTSGPLLKPKNGLVASERHSDKRCSLVHFSESYLIHATNTRGINPVFWKWPLHHAVPMITFGHAAAISGLNRF